MNLRHLAVALLLVGCGGQSTPPRDEVVEEEVPYVDLMITENVEDPFHIDCVSSLEEDPRAASFTDAEFDAQVALCVRMRTEREYAQQEGPS